MFAINFLNRPLRTPEPKSAFRTCGTQETPTTQHLLAMRPVNTAASVGVASSARTAAPAKAASSPKIRPGHTSALLLAALILLASMIALPGCQNNPQRKEPVGSQISVFSSASAGAQEESVLVEDASAAPIKIEKSGWWAKDGYVHYGIMVTNPNQDYAAHNTTVHVKLLDQDGEVFWEGDDTLSYIGPGGQTGFAGDAGDGWVPAEVSIETDVESTEWYTAAGSYDPITIESMEEEDKLYFRYELSGDLTNNTPDYVSTISLCALLLDDQGEILAGYTGEAYKYKAGQTKPYLQTIHSAPDHAQVLLFAQIVN